MTLKEYVENIPDALCAYALQKFGDDWLVLVEGRGWFAPQWFRVPTDVALSEQDLKAYQLLPTKAGRWEGGKL